MKNFYMKYKNPISIALDIALIILGILSRSILFTVSGLLLLFLTLYVSKFEKRKAEEDAKILADKKAAKAALKQQGKGKKKKKKKRK